MRWLRKVPGLKSRSSIQLGGLLGLFLVLAVALLLSLVQGRYMSRPPPELLEAMAGVGGTLLVAYSVVITNLVRAIRERGADREFFLGFSVGLAFCGVIGIALALLLLLAAKPLSWIHRLGLCWSGAALLFLAAIVAVSPVLADEDARSRHFDQDE